MNKHLVTTSLLCLLATPCVAQTSTATGVGVGVAKSSSQSGAVAISGQGGQGGNSSLTVNNPANTRTESVLSGTTTSNINQTVSGGTNNRNEQTGTSTVKNVPGTLAPGLAAAGIETCLGSVSGGGSIVGFGASFGTTVPDPGCQARLDARTLWSMGLKGAAVARLCLSPEIQRSMPDVCARYTPVVVEPVGGYPLIAPRPVRGGPDYGYPPARVAGAPIEVVEGKTGLTKLCDNYDEPAQKCRKWTGQPTRLANKPSKRTIAKLTPQPAPSTPAAAVAAATSPDP
jgi:hypothetical protein